MLIDIEQLDDHNKKLLLDYLIQQNEVNPDQFPFPKEFIEDYLMKLQNGQEQENESVKDIKSDEMIVEEADHDQQQDTN